MKLIGFLESVTLFNSSYFSPDFIQHTLEVGPYSLLHISGERRNYPELLLLFIILEPKFIYVQDYSMIGKCKDKFVPVL
jgi:hypothetical protein